MNELLLLAVLIAQSDTVVQPSGSSGSLPLGFVAQSARHTPTAATFVVAAVDSVHKARADFRCDGVDDQEELQDALGLLPSSGGRVVLLEGTYSWFDVTLEPPQISDDVEITGMGRGTRILVGADVAPFVLRAVNGVRLHDFEVTLELGNAHSEDVFRLEAAALGERTYYNAIERVSVANPSVSGTPQYTGLRLRASDEGGGAGSIPGVYGNVFRDVVLEQTGTAIALETAGSDTPWVNGNAFESIRVFQFVTGVEFVRPASPFAAGANRNRFLDVKLQSANFSVDGFKNIGRRGNVFSDCLVGDWQNAASPNAAWSVESGAEDTWILTTDVPADSVDAGQRTIVLNGVATLIGGELVVGGRLLHVSPEGLVGLGTAEPASKLCLGRNYVSAPAVSDYEADAITFYDDNDGFGGGEVRAKIAVLQELDEVNGQIWPDVTGMGFYTETGGPGHNLAERVRIDTRGRVGIGTTRPTARLDVDSPTGSDQLRLRTSYTPSGSNDPAGEVGNVCWDDDYVYVKTSIGWRRAALQSW